jgi:uncharacterized protein with ParB-like and HNH nuclease domain
MKANDLAISELLNVDMPVVYTIPRYQRNFTWGKSEWEEFFYDINDNDKGYFLGSIICINQGSDPFKPQLELVDGQQRMITLSLLYAAIYSKLNDQRELLNDDQKNQLYNLKLRLVLRKEPDKIRVIPQILNNIQIDYRAVLNSAGVLKSQGEASSNASNKYIFKAYRFFLNRIEDIASQSDNKIDSTLEYLEKVDSARLIMINAESHSNAYMLFESLNNRGVELSAVDLIKNKLLHTLKEPIPGDYDNDLERWNNFIKYLGEDNRDFKVQERFFRQYYNAFRKTLLSKEEMKKLEGSSIATRSNLIRIYENIIKTNPEDFLDKIIEAGPLYSIILGRIEDKEFTHLKQPLLDLKHIEGTPSYVLLLYLLKNKTQLGLIEKHFIDIVLFLVNFFVRRNLTDKPATNSLMPLFMKIIDGVNDLSGDSLVKKIKHELISESSNDGEFQGYLQGPIYSESSSIDRFILCAIEEKSWLENEPIYDLWKKMNGKYFWTIEHIFPQGKKIPRSWIDMIANGDETKARDIQAQHVDRLGNLTLTGYNSDLSNMSFKKKRDRKNKDGKFIGYMNQLHLNDDIKKLDKWTVEGIENRTTQLVERALELFALSEESELIETRQNRKNIGAMDNLSLD